MDNTRSVVDDYRELFIVSSVLTIISVVQNNIELKGLVITV